jgi:hypothetical protein
MKEEDMERVKKNESLQDEANFYLMQKYSNKLGKQLAILREKLPLEEVAESIEAYEMMTMFMDLVVDRSKEILG